MINKVTRPKTLPFNLSDPVENVVSINRSKSRETESEKRVRL